MHPPKPALSTPKAVLRLMLSCTLVLALCVPALAVLLPAQDAAAAGSGTVKLVRDGTWIEYDNYRTASMHDAKTGYQIVCAQPAKDSPETGTYTKDYDGIDEQIEATSTSTTWVKIRKFLVRALMYYAHPDSPGFDKTLFPDENWEGDGWTRDDYIAMLHLSLSAAYDNSFKAAVHNTGETFQNWVVKNITGGYAAGDEIDGQTSYYGESVWGKLLNCSSADVAGWDSDTNPYYHELPDGFRVYILHPGGADQVCFGFDAFGWAAVAKKSSIANITDGNRLYSFEGAVYGVYSDKACEKLVTKIEVGADGRGSSAALDPGTYYVKELSAPWGFAKDATVAKVEVTACKTATFTSRETPKHAAPDLLARKLNAETGNPSPVAASTLEGAQFTVSYYDSFEDFDVPTRSWTFRSGADGTVELDEAHLVRGDALYTDSAGKPVFPLGHYTVQETVAPEGYLRDDEVHAFDLRDTGNDNAATISFDHVTTVPEQVFRGDVEFRKVDDGQNGLAGIPFLLSYNNGEEGSLAEAHVIVTDVNGSFSSAKNAHSAKTNANDAALEKSSAGEWLVDEEKLDPDAGVWFSMDKTGATSSPDDGKGALPYGSYRLEELPCAANEGKTLVTTGFTIDKDKTTVRLGNLVDGSPSLSTSARDRADGDSYLEPAEKAQIVDTVRYQNLIAGTTYELTGTLVLASTGEPLSDDEGRLVSQTETFTATRSSGTCQLGFSFDASALAGEKVVVFEVLALNGKTIAAHENLTNADQTVEVLPKIATSAHDKADGDSYITSTEATIVDTVSYEGLRAGETYKLDALLMDKTTGNVARDENGDAISGSREFSPESAKGAADVEIALDTTVVGGHDIVVFETLRDADDVVLATHKDLEDAGQTLKTVGIDTVARDAADQDAHFAAEAQRVTIEDEVSYVNLEPSTSYTLETTLVDKATGMPIEENGSPVRTTQTFVPETANGTVRAELSFDPTMQAATEIVVFESLEYEGNEVAAHTDLDDEDQTVTGVVPEEGAPGSGSGYVSTGDAGTLAWAVAGAIAVLAACVAGVAAYRRKLAASEDGAPSDASD